MPMNKITTSVIAALMAGVAHAAPAPAPSTACGPTPTDAHDPFCTGPDKRIRTFNFNEATTLRITSAGLTPVRIIFGKDDRVDAILGNMVNETPGEAKYWFAKRAGNNITLQPLRRDLPHSILFLTNSSATKDWSGNDVVKNYVIELVVGEGDATDPNDDRAYTQVTVVDPKEVAVAAAAAGVARARTAGSTVNAQAIATRFTQARFAVPRNWHYEKMDDKGCPKLTPPADRNWVSDDGQQTTMLYPPRIRVPAMFEYNESGDESLIDTKDATTAAGVMVILPRVYEKIVLRRGDLVCVLRNTTYTVDAPILDRGTGTISRDVVRVRASPRE